jgi:uncharacterized membrane protein YphA (DoxX/SURF4 family)
MPLSPCGTSNWVFVSELKLLSASEPRNIVGEWALPIGVGGIFIIFGWEKFSSTADSHWVTMFRQIGFGEWFRYAAGVIEVAGGLLVLLPRTLLIGLATLALTMAAAVFIVAFVLGHPTDSLFPGIFLAGLIGFFAWARQNRER